MTKPISNKARALANRVTNTDNGAWVLDAATMLIACAREIDFLAADRAAWYDSTLRAVSDVKRLEAIIAGFYDAIAHGDDAHRDWLRTTINEYLETRTTP